MKNLGNEHVVLQDTNFVKYDLNFLRKLNEEYRSKPFMSSFPQYTDEYQLKHAMHRVEHLAKMVPLQGKRILEVGCGGGYVSYSLAKTHNCSVIGVDIYQSEVWDRLQHPSLQFHCVDLCKCNFFHEASFDLIVSYVAWEHMRHPFTMLQECTKLLKKGGQFYLYANLYRSALASHLYRHIFFPHPHLLFDDSILIPYALEQGVEQWWIDAFYYVNKLTYAEYKDYFARLDLKICHEEKSFRNLDWDFYRRFEDKLGLYPIQDLEMDFFGVLLQKGEMDFQDKRWFTLCKPSLDGSSFEKGTPIQATAIARGIDLQYAWYVLRNGERVHVQWYTTSEIFKFVPEMDGLYQLVCFAKDSDGNKKRVYSDKFEIR